MKRRDLLKRTTAAVAGIGLAGCVSRGGDGADASNGDGTGGSEDGDSTGGGGSDGSADTTPTIASEQIVESKGSCGQGNDAAVSFEDGTIRIDGEIPAPDPCHRAELQRASYDSAADELSVAVTIVDEGGMCSQCLAGIEYVAEVRYEGSTPGTVSVSHATGKGTEEVATASK